MPEIPTCWYFFASGNTKVIYFALGDAKEPNASSFASQWNIGLRSRHCRCTALFAGNEVSGTFCYGVSVFKVLLMYI